LLSQVGGFKGPFGWQVFGVITETIN